MANNPYMTNPVEQMAARLQAAGVDISGLSPNEIATIYQQNMTGGRPTPTPQQAFMASQPGMYQSQVAGPPNVRPNVEGPRPMPPPRPQISMPPNVRPNVPGPRPTAPTFNPHAWGMPENMSSSALSVAAASPRANASPNVAAGMAQQRQLRGLAPEGQVPPMPMPRPQPSQSPPKRSSPTAETRAADAKAAIEAKLGPEAAAEAGKNTQLGQALMMMGFTMLANSNAPGGFFEALGKGGQAGLETYITEDQRRQNNERAERAEDREDKRVGYEGQRVGLEGKRVAQGDRGLDLQEVGLYDSIKNNAERLKLDRGRLNLAERGLQADIADRATGRNLQARGLDLEAQRLKASEDFQKWNMAFQEDQVDTKLQQYRDDLQFRMVDLGLSVTEAKNKADYMAAMTANMKDSKELSWLNYNLEKAKYDQAAANRVEKIIAEATAKLFTDDGGLLDAEQLMERAVALEAIIREQMGAPKLVSPDELPPG